MRVFFLHITRANVFTRRASLPITEVGGVVVTCLFEQRRCGGSSSPDDDNDHPENDMPFTCERSRIGCLCWQATSQSFILHPLILDTYTFRYMWAHRTSQGHTGFIFS